MDVSGSVKWVGGATRAGTLADGTAERACYYLSMLHGSMGGMIRDAFRYYAD